MARPRKDIKPEQVESLAAINCSYAEIAAVVGCDVSMLNRRFKQAIEKGRDQGKSSLKRKMWETAMNGNCTMMIWLSKQMLGYTDKVEQKQDITKAEVTIVKIPENEIKEEAKSIETKK
jgi:hypothetical protein